MHRTLALRTSSLATCSATIRRDASGVATSSRRRHSTATATTSPSTSQHKPIPSRGPVDPFVLLAPELAYVRSNLLSLLGSAQPSLTDITSYYFKLSGKQLRPLLVLLFASATNGLGSKFADRLLLPQNTPDGGLRRELDAPLSSPHILNDWNPRMPDYTASFAEPFEIPSRFARYSSPKPPNVTPSTSVQSTSTPTPTPHFPPSTNILPTQIRLAQISEMIHVASLLHDDVIDHASTRRSAPSAPAAFGNKLSILGGDFLLGRTSSALSRLGENEVVELMSTVVANLIEGEVMQLRDVVGNGAEGSSVGTEDVAPSTYSSNSSPALPATTLEVNSPSSQIWTTYLRKSYYKTASLMAKSCRASVVLGGTEMGHVADEELKDVAYAFGRNIGIAFQVSTTPLCLDYFTSTCE